MQQTTPKGRLLNNASQLQHVRVVAEQILLGVVEEEDRLANNLASLIIQLLRRRAENRLEDGDQLGCEMLDCGLV
jgi:hypothetical protein